MGAVINFQSSILVDPNNASNERGFIQLQKNVFLAFDTF